MKKILSAIVASVMALSAFAPVVTAQDEQMAEILKTVKERIEIPQELEKFESGSYEDSESGVTVYNFAWRSDESEINVSCTGSKVITSYSKYTSKRVNYDGTPSFPKHDKEKIQTQAQNFIDKINPGMELKAEDTEENLYGNQTYFPVSREKNGIKVEGDRGSISVDNETGEVENFYISWTELAGFEEGEPALKTAEEIQKTFNEKLGFELVYRKYTKDKKIIFYPAYIEKNSGKYIDAVTGEVVEPEYGYSNMRYASSNTADMAEAQKGEGGGGGFSSAEEAELDKVSGLISKADIENKVRNNKVIDIPSEYKLRNIYLSRDYYDEESYTYSIYFISEDKEGIISVTADAKTGDIYDIGKRNAKTTMEAAGDKAADVLKTLAPSISGEYSVNGEKMSRYENGIRVVSDNAYVWEDSEGEIAGFSVSYTKNAEFPSVQDALSIEEASEKIFGAVDYGMKYFPHKDKKAYLVYCFEDEINLNALSGKMVGYNNEEITDKQYAYSDLEGHYAKEMIERLTDFNIGLEGEEFRPDDYITSVDFKELISHIFSRTILLKAGGEEDKETDETKEITREEAAILMIRAMGAEEYAKHNDIYTQPFADVTENKGYISLLSAMKVVNGDENGNFNPERLLTRAEAAVIVYNYLSR